MCVSECGVDVTGEGAQWMLGEGPWPGQGGLSHPENGTRALSLRWWVRAYGLWSDGKQVWESRHCGKHLEWKASGLGFSFALLRDPGQSLPLSGAPFPPQKKRGMHSMSLEVCVLQA